MQLRMDDEGWYKFHFNSKPDEYGEVYKYEIRFQYRTSTDEHKIYNSVKMLNDCDEDILYFDSENCKVSTITTVPTKYTIIGVKGSIEFLNKVIQKLKENDGCMCDVWNFNEEHYDTPFEELDKLCHANEKVKENYYSLFREKYINENIRRNDGLLLKSILKK